MKKILNRPITKFYNGDDVNIITAELWLINEANVSYKKQCQYMYLLISFIDVVTPVISTTQIVSDFMGVQHLIQ